MSQRLSLDPGYPGRHGHRRSMERNPIFHMQLVSPTPEDTFPQQTPQTILASDCHLGFFSESFVIKCFVGNVKKITLIVLRLSLHGLNPVPDQVSHMLPTP